MYVSEVVAGFSPVVVLAVASLTELWESGTVNSRDERGTYASMKSAIGSVLVRSTLGRGLGVRDEPATR